MLSKWTASLLITSVILLTLGGCRKEEEPTPTPPLPTSTAIPNVGPTATAVPTPTPTIVSLGLAPLDVDTPLVPRVVGQNPAPGEEAPVDGFFEVYFDQPMDREATVAAWRLVDDAGNAVDGEVSWPQPRVMRFKPARNLKPNTRYKASLAEAARSAEGTTLLEGLTLSFDTVGDLAVSQVSPASGVADVTNESTITIIFNRPVVPLVIAEEQANLPSPLEIAPAIKGQGEWLNTSVYIFRPQQPLIGRQSYTAKVSAQVVNEISATGATMAADYQWSFTVAAPTILGLDLPNRTTSPQDETTDLPLDQSFQVTFQQPMEPVSTEAAVSLVSDDGSRAGLQFDWDESYRTLIFTPTQDLDLATRYTLQVQDAAQSIHGGRLREGLTWHGTTVQRPAVLNTSPGNGQTEERFTRLFRINFASPMDLESLKGKVIFTPPLAGDPEGYYGQWDWSLRFYGLAASTTYTVRLLPGMSDPHGNQIVNEQTITFTTAPYSPMATFNFPGRLSLYRQGGSTTAWVSFRNLDQLQVDLYRLTLGQFSGLLSGMNEVDYTPGTDALVWSQTRAVSAPFNALGKEAFQLIELAGDELPPGLYFVTLDSPQVRHDFQHLQAQPVVVATANITLKTTATESLIWVTDLDSGAPLAGVPVALYEEGSGLILRETTDSNGLVYRDDLNLDTGYRTTYYAVTEDPTAGTFGVAISGWNDGVQPYDFGIYTDFFLRPDEPTAYVYTDRPIYRPGQPVYFKGIVRLNDDLAYSLPGFDEVQVTISSFDETVFSESVPLSEFGSFDAQFTLDDEAALGSYYISVLVQDQWIGNGNFDVAEYRKPTFQVNVNATETDVLVGDTIHLQGDAQFFSGGAVVDGSVEWVAYAADYTFRPGGDLSRYSFTSDDGNWDPYAFDFYPSSTFIASGSGQTDGNGRFDFAIPAELDEEDGSRQFTIEATVTDVAGNIVSGRTDVVVHRSLVYPGIRSSGYVGQAGKEMSFDIILVDWDEEPVSGSGQTADVSLVERRWYSVQEEVDGQVIWRSTVEEIPVQEENRLSVDAQGRASVTFVPPSGGIYRAYVTTADSQGNEAIASTDVWVSGREFVPWRRINDHSFELVADADSYRPGDTAELLIASPFPGEAYALVTVERGHIQRQEVVRLTSNSTIYQLPITGEMAPNVFVSVLVIKGIDELNPLPDFKLGMVQFEVEREEQELNVTITPDRNSAGPGDEITYSVQVSDHQGRPVEAEVSLALVDLAALTIAAPNSRPILDHFYSERWLSVNTALLLTRLMDAFNQEIEDEDKGGGGGGGEFGIIDIREEFPDTAYWEGQVQTDSGGRAAVTITLPDNLTTWRMDARAVTKDTRVGQGTADLVATLPLLVSPQTPRFFIVGDTAVLATAVHNNTATPLEATVMLAAEGVTLDSPASQMVTIPAGQQAVVQWWATVADVDRVDLVFSASGGGYADASRPPLGTLDRQGIPVYKYEVPETVGTSGELTEGGAIVESIALPVIPGFELTEGHVTIEVAPSLAAAMTEGLDYLEHNPYECTEQIVSRFLPNVLTTRALKQAGQDDPVLTANLAEQVNIGLQRLYSRQHPDGGWPWWDESTSNTLITAYVVQALVEARDSGYLVSDGVIEQGIRFLWDNLREIDGLDGRFKINRQAFLVYVLARADKPPTSDINTLFEGRQSLDIYARGYLAQAIRLMDETDPRLTTLAADFVSTAVLSASGTHWEEAERDYWNWNSDTRTTAIVLDTMIKLDPENPLVANAVRWLMAHRTNGYWHGTQETAWSLMALTNWMVASGELEADYQAEVAVNGQLLLSEAITPEVVRDSWQLQVDVADLLTDGLNRLAIGRSDGPGNLYYTARLQASLPVEQVRSLDRGIIVSRSYFDPEDRETPVSEMAHGETFLARLTIIVPETLHYVIIEDFLPAGLEAVDTSLKTSQQVGAPQRYDDADVFAQGWRWWVFNHVELRDEKVVLSADTLPPGTYEYVYLVRAATAGEYRVIPPTAHEFYFPEVYGRGDGSLFVVRSEE